MVLALLALPAALAQDTEEKKAEVAQMDELSKKVLENWRKSEYHLGREGVKKASCKAKLNVSANMQSMSSNLTYEWDGEKSTLEFENSQLQMRMRGGAGVKRQFEEWLKSEELAKSFGAAKLTAKESEAETVITVVREEKTGIKSLTFNGEGVMSQAILGAPDGMGGTTDVTIEFTFEKVDGKYFRTGQKFEREVLGRGTAVSTTKTTYAKAGAFRPVQKSEMSTTLGGMTVQSMSLELSDWKFDDDVDKMEESGPAEGGG
jgi:hypothetical protein